MTKRILVVGRHAGSLPPEFEVVETQSITFSTEFWECCGQINEVFSKAAMLEAVPVFQNTPGIVAAALSKVSGEWGVIVSKPGERKSGVVKTFDFGMPAEATFFVGMAATAQEAVKFVNARAVTAIDKDRDILTITVDPVTEFVFDHIEFVKGE